MSMSNSLGDFVDVFEITGGAFIKKYQRWSASSEMSADKTLLDKDFITQESGNTSKLRKKELKTASNEETEGIA